LVVSILMVVALAACSSDAPDQSGDRTRLGGQQGSGAQSKGGGKEPKGVLKKAAKVGEKAGASGSDSGGTATSGSKAAGQPPSEATSSEINPAFARRVASQDDPRDDAQKEGITPSYAEIIKASIVGLGEDFKMTLTLDGQLPDRMPNDKTHMIVAFGITGTEENEGYSFGAQCTENGWNAYAGGRDDSNGEFPGTFFARGNTVEMTVPWAYINGPRAFEWYAASNWFAQIANQTHYRVDLSPNGGLAKFPQ
jgi:hypothetical protein